VAFFLSGPLTLLGSECIASRGLIQHHPPLEPTGQHADVVGVEDMLPQGLARLVELLGHRGLLGEVLAGDALDLLFEPGQPGRARDATPRGWPGTGALYERTSVKRLAGFICVRPFRCPNRSSREARRSLNQEDSRMPRRMPQKESTHELTQAQEEE
jgi:hypothetical protein